MSDERLDELDRQRKAAMENYRLSSDEMAALRRAREHGPCYLSPDSRRYLGDHHLVERTPEGFVLTELGAAELHASGC